MNLIEVFQDTLKHSEDLKQSTSIKYTFDDMLPPKLGMYKDNITIVNSDTVSALIEYNVLGKTCILNMASSKRPGGGVANGARAQEECLFRCSNLAQVIPTTFYRLEEHEAIYTERAIFFKNKDYLYIDNIECDVVTIPAINLNSSDKNRNYEQVTKNKIRLMLSLAIKSNVKIMILGAWGCGVFGNDPNIMSQYFMDVLIGEGYNLNFNKVIFAIINDHNSVDNNFEIFKKRIGKVSTILNVINKD